MLTSSRTDKSEKREGSMTLVAPQTASYTSRT